MRRVVLSLRLAILASAVAVALPPVSIAAAQSPPACSYPPLYPGDFAARPDVAAWMAARAAAAGLPAELPVMAALVESGMQNGPSGDGDSVGFFQMRVGIWNHGDYKGYPGNSELQMKWFIDSATSVKLQAMAGGDANYGRGPGRWGGWIADALGTPTKRGRYESQLHTARGLIEGGRAGVGTWPYEGTYPGDDAPRAVIAAWMATRAIARALPPELPIMASLVESGLQNPSFGDADGVGFFNMRLSIWNTGPYAGYPQQPELQIKWFLDQAHLARAQRIAAGDQFFGESPSQYGEWIADVERPAESFRGRYQLRLDEARALFVLGCAHR